MTTIRIGDRLITPRKTYENSQEAAERTIKRIYGVHAWMKPRDTGWRDGERFRGYADIYRSLGGGQSTLLDSHVWIEVYPSDDLTN